MNRFFALTAITFLLVTASACGTAKPPTAPAAQGSKVTAALEDLSSFYGKKDLDAFMGLVHDSFKDRKAFAASIKSVFSKYETVQFTVQYTKMFITIDDKGMARATFNWDSGWETTGGSILKNGGRVVFVFEPKNAKLTAIEGKSPFIPQAIESQRKQ
jgi:hypothetical protein